MKHHTAIWPGADELLASENNTPARKLIQTGEQFLQHATKILFEMENARVTLGQLGKWGQGRLRLGVSTTACQYVLPAVLR